MSLGSDGVYEVPVWSGASLAVAVRGYEVLEGRDVVLERGWTPRLWDLPLLGVEWMCEYYLDTGSKSARGLSGVEEGFIIKTSVYARCAGERGVRERILYPSMKPRSPHPFLPLRGSDRLRQAASYIAEIAALLALARGEADLPRDVDDYPRLVVRHGSILQRIEGYMNEVYDLPRDAAESILYYSGLDSHTVGELIRASTVRRRGKGDVVSPGIIAALIIDMLKGSVGGEANVVGVVEEVSRGRHLVIQSLIEVSKALSEVDPSLSRLVERGLEALPSSNGDPLSCIDDVDPESLSSEDLYGRRDRYSGYVRGIIYRGVIGLEDKDLRSPSRVRELIELSRSLTDEDYVRRIYRGQVLNRYVALASDSHFLMLYNYLYGSDDSPPATPRHSKSLLIAPIAADNLVEKGLDEETRIRARDLRGMIDGVEYRYIFPDVVPPCSRLQEMSRRLGVERRLLAELVKVKPPIRLEYFSNDGRRDLIDTKIHASSYIMQYGLPPQLLVVDSRSRVDEWDYRALRALLELQEKRVAPYITFIRDFHSRLKYIV